jgi:hypothetical protein
LLTFGALRGFSVKEKLTFQISQNKPITRITLILTYSRKSSQNTCYHFGFILSIMSDFKKYYDLWNKTEDYTDEEFNFLKKEIKNKKFTVTYGFYNKESSQKKQIALIINTDPFMTRRTGVESNWEYIETRDITNLEIEEYINFHFRKAYKRFLVFYYNNVDKLIHDDKKLNAVTPDNFIEKCRKKGYSGTFQLKLDYSY